MKKKPENLQFYSWITNTLWKELEGDHLMLMVWNGSVFTLDYVHKSNKDVVLPDGVWSLSIGQQFKASSPYW